MVFTSMNEGGLEGSKGSSVKVKTDHEQISKCIKQFVLMVVHSHFVVHLVHFGCPM